MTDSNQAARAEAFRALHHGRTPVILANIWDAGTAVLAAEAGFPAIATSSAGVAWAAGLPDGEVIGRDAMLAAVAAVAAAVDLPVSADMETGYGEAPETVAETTSLTAETGAVGINIEDGVDHAEGTVMDLPLAVERIAAARLAADAAGVPMVINARTDVYFGSSRSAEEKRDQAVERANAYLAAGADCAFVIAVNDRAAVPHLVAGIDGPLNLTAGAGGLSLGEMADLGVRRISFAGALSRGAYGWLRRAFADILAGDTAFLGDAIPHLELNKLYAKRRT